MPKGLTLSSFNIFYCMIYFPYRVFLNTEHIQSNNCKTQKTATFANGSKDSIDDNRRQTTFDDICIYRTRVCS